MPDAAAQPPRASRTAMITSMMRALHTRYDRPPLIHDDWADRLITSEEKRDMAAAALGLDPCALDAAAASADPALRDRLQMLSASPPDLILHTAWRSLGVYGNVILRTRHTEDRLAAAVARGIGQYVLIGAGFDSFALRRPDFARELAIYEVDHPASQEKKRERIAKSAAVIPPGPLHFVPADLSAEPLAHALSGAGFRADRPALFSWLGVTMYLTPEANRATLRSFASFAPGSELIFTYLEKRLLESGSPAMTRARAAAAAMGEPWISGFDSATLPAELSGLGLHIIEDLGHQETVARYCTHRTDDLTPGRAGRICCAIVNPNK